MAETTVMEGELNIEQITWKGITWVNIEKPTPKETEYLAQNYPFHPLDLDDCLSRIQRPKIDEYEDYLFIVLHFPIFSPESRVTVPSQVSIFIGKEYLVTLHAGVLKPLTKLFRDCQINEEARQENMKSPGCLLYRITDRLVDYCLPITNKIMWNIEKVENDIFATKGRGTVREISVIRRDIISFRRIIWPMRAVVGTLERKTERFTKEDMEVYWDDAVDHIDKIWDTLDTCKEIIEGLKDTNDSLYTHRTNEVMRIITILATISLPLTVIASIFGMNIWPFSNGWGESHLAFAVAALVMLLISGLMLLFFRLRRWI